MQKDEGVDSHGYLDTCCIREIEEGRKADKLDAFLRTQDPIRRAIQARQIQPSMTSFVACKGHHIHGPNCNHEHEGHCDHDGGCGHEHEPAAKDKSSDDDSVFGSDLDNDETFAKLREMRLKDMKMAQQKQTQVKDGKALSEVPEETFETRMAPYTTDNKTVVIALLFDDSKRDAKDVQLMRRYLQDLSSDPSLEQISFWAVSVQPTSDMGWSRSGLLFKLMVPVIPALISLRRGQVMNRCVGAFEGVFPDFTSSPASVRSWLLHQVGVRETKTATEPRRQKITHGKHLRLQDDDGDDDDDDDDGSDSDSDEL